MLHLFSLPTNLTLAEKIRQMHDSQLAGIFGRTILNRGYDYADAIESVEVKPGRAAAEIYGTELYEVTIEHRSGDVFGDCSCPYDGGACKHLAALLMHLRDNGGEELEQINPLKSGANSSPEGRPAAFDFDQHLQGLSAEELRALLRQFVPESYRRSLAAQHTPPEANQKAFQSAVKKVRELFKKVEQYGPDDFESTLLKRLSELRPFWLSDAEATTELLQECIEGIDAAQSEGYLYDNYADSVFDGSSFGRYLAEFVAAQPAESMLTVLKPLVEAFDELEYSIATNFLPELTELLSDTKRRAIAPFFLNTDAVSDLEDRHQRVIWQHYQPLLDFKEKDVFLQRLNNNNFFVLELADLWEREGSSEIAIKILEKALPVREQPKGFTYFRFSGFTEKNKLFERRIELEQRYRKSRELEKWTTRYVQETASAESLHFAVKHLPEQQKLFEPLLQKANVEAYAQYLEDGKRLDEVVQLFQMKTGAPTQQTQYDFFKRHKKAYPEIAKTIFSQVLATELVHTGDSHYRAVTEVLIQMKAIEPSEQFQLRVNAIKNQFKRRSNLMAMLANAKL